MVVGVGAFDCHMGAVGGQIEPHHLSKVMGTSTCDMMVVPKDDMTGKLVRGICGQVEGSIIPGMIGLEAGQSAFGDTFAWFKNIVAWPISNLLKGSSVISPDIAIKLEKELLDKLIPELTRQAAAIPLDENNELEQTYLHVIYNTNNGILSTHLRIEWHLNATCLWYIERVRWIPRIQKIQTLFIKH